jgi:hypothetical protein
MRATGADECDLVFEGQRRRLSFLVAESPNSADVPEDGILGWQLFQWYVLKVDAEKSKVTILPGVPEEVTKWTCLRVQSDFGTLDLAIPGRDKTLRIRIDTGSSAGVKIPALAWSQWKAGHPAAPKTLNCYLGSVGPQVVSEEAWADEFPIGAMVLTGVPVMEARSTELPSGSDYLATLGLAAIKRSELVVDGVNGMAYLRPRKTPPLLYEHNCLGAVFIPAIPGGQELFAHVADGSPAYQAGIRNGDRLVAIDASKWPHMLETPLFWTPTNGVKLRFTLTRKGEAFSVTAELHQILGSSPKRSPGD